MKRNYLLALCLLVGCQIVGNAQSTDITVKGVVLDQMGASVGRAEITVTSKTVKRELKSDEAGTFRVELPPGTYQVVIQSPGFRVFKLSKLRVREDMSELKVVLKVMDIKYGKCPKGQICLWL
jgi:hypothetical protein